MNKREQLQLDLYIRAMNVTEVFKKEKKKCIVALLLP